MIVFLLFLSYLGAFFIATYIAPILLVYFIGACTRRKHRTDSRQTPVFRQLVVAPLLFVGTGVLYGGWIVVGGAFAVVAWSALVSTLLDGVIESFRSGYRPYVLSVTLIFGMVLLSLRILRFCSLIPLDVSRSVGKFVAPQYRYHVFAFAVTAVICLLTFSACHRLNIRGTEVPRWALAQSLTTVLSVFFIPPFLANLARERLWPFLSSAMRPSEWLSLAALCAISPFVWIAILFIHPDGNPATALHRLLQRLVGW